MKNPDIAKKLPDELYTDGIDEIDTKLLKEEILFENWDSGDSGDSGFDKENGTDDSKSKTKIKPRISREDRRNFYEEDDFDKIKPRVSREERTKGRRGHIPSHLLRARKSAKNSYMFFIALLGICFIATQVYIRQNPDSIKTEAKNITLSKSKSININLIDQDGRYGLLVFLVNDGNEDWQVENLEVVSIYTTNLNQNIKSKYAVFIPLEQKIKSVNDIDINIK